MSITRITPEVSDAIAVATETLNSAIGFLIDAGLIGLASEVGDVRDLLGLLAADSAADLLAG